MLNIIDRGSYDNLRINLLRYGVCGWRHCWLFSRAHYLQSIQEKAVNIENFVGGLLLAAALFFGWCAIDAFASRLVGLVL